ncbi:CgeB family protein [Paenibacillus turpanensis]|uniref:CgeB family protein n=1 Tax=Paenibacillus turpanensis TaxID=2689078 RepID=UPI001FB66568|nr:glycosyltransferase [Paenibacillus turpanensis]
MPKETAAIRGSEAGFRLGEEHGYHYGRCEALLRSIPPAEYQAWPLRVLFIPQGFPAIDCGIISALTKQSAELIVGQQTDLAGQAAAHQPDLLLVMNGLHTFPATLVEELNTVRGMGIPSAVWFADDPYFTDFTVELAPHFDYVFTHELGCIELYRGAGCRQVHYLPLAANLEVFRPRPAGMNYRADLCFIGTGFWNRIELFDRLTPFLRGKKVIIAGGMWDRLKHYKKLASSIISEGIPPEQTPFYYSGAKIVINLHRSWKPGPDNRNSRGVPALSINPRTFEMSACGTFQLTDLRHDLPSYYVPGSEVGVFQTTDELIAKIEYYLRHEEQRKEAALRALGRTAREHSYDNRVHRLLHAVFGG